MSVKERRLIIQSISRILNAENVTKNSISTRHECFIASRFCRILRELGCLCPPVDTRGALRGARLFDPRRFVAVGLLTLANPQKQFFLQLHVSGLFNYGPFNGTPLCPTLVHVIAAASVVTVEAFTTPRH